MLRVVARRAALASAASPRATRHAMPLFPSPRPMLPSSWRFCSSDGSGGSNRGGSSGGTAAEAFVPLFSRNGYKPTDRTQRRRPLAPELDEAGEEAGARRFGAQRLLPAGSDAQYSFVIGTAGINVLSVHSPSEGASAGSAHETSGSIRAW